MSPILQSLANGSARGYGAFFGAGAAPAFDSIASTVLGADAATVTFSSIPSTYQHLQIRVNARSTYTSTTIPLRVIWNSDSGNNYARHDLSGNGTTVTATGNSTSSLDNYFFAGLIPAASATSSIFGVSIIDIHDYASTTKNKTIRAITGEDRNGAGNLYLSSGLWINTSAISSITLQTNASDRNFIAGSTFSLYGVKGA